MFRRFGAFFLDILEVVVLAFAIFLFSYLFIFQPHKIDGNSMEPNFHDKEYLLTDKVKYKILKESPQRGDVIVFIPPLERDKEYIKRIIGLPGETVSIKEGRIIINGEILEETYLSAGTPTSGAYFLQEGEIATVPPDEYFVMGDNRANSSDSRYWGFVPKKDLVGRAWLVYWPPQETRKVKAANYNF
ncbi:signal peptidase I [Candidatus Woesebacteria bacterium RBG_19FT_COMBO_47_8]|uniref:Signal peptidase I n=1 Tax=Candidatus Woesebacteria bacterium RBG_13_46_13 TaxID=1802479 RepID=A0A1F7X614_9BACT|nr:MAG: signal peptidase I [Candidatus Woesebacteria bacterium RBG_13_46_13]OGM18193.1 MAG: signal peptidase I [Candidatus Woesebacteria bacterium RBG_19FT_COMBO_47_8]HJX58932.1 signal peptidase I [Patescibacteria group bacterium]